MFIIILQIHSLNTIYMSITFTICSCYIYMYMFSSYITMRSITPSMRIFMLCILLFVISTYLSCTFEIKIRKKGLGCDNVILRFINIKYRCGMV